MLKVIQDTDFQYIYNLYMHPATNAYLMYEMMSVEEFTPIFQDLLAQNIIYIFEQEGKNVGMVKIVPWHHRCSHINYIGGLAIHPEYAGKGYGSKMIEAVKAHCQANGVKRLELSTATFNTAAINLYLKHGFETEGILRNYCYLKSESRYIDEQVMSYIYE